MESVFEENSNYTSAAQNVAVASVVMAEFVTCLSMNLFILVFTLWHPKVLKNSSTILLTNFVVLNLLFGILYIPTIVVSSIAEGWVYGRTGKEKYGVCSFMAMVLLWYGLNSILTLTAISVDRFLFIVKPIFYRQYNRPWIAKIAIPTIWLLSCLPGILPLAGIGAYVYDPFSAACVPYWPESKLLVAIFFTTIFTCFGTIVVFTVWTFCFTMSFLRRNRNIIGTNNTSADDSESIGSIYHRKMCKLIGIFGMLLFVTSLSYLPLLIKFLVGASGNPANTLNTAVLIFLSLNTILNPVIQLYFRKELSDYLVNTIEKAKTLCCVKLSKLRHRTTQNTELKV